MIFEIVGGLIVGLSLGIFGSGGSILTVPVLIYLLHHPEKIAITESLAIVGAIAFFSAIPYAHASLVQWRTAVIFAIPGILGTLFGAWIAAYVPGYIQLFVFAIVMFVAAISMWKRATSGHSAQATTPPPARSSYKLGLEGLGVGVLTGFVGVGGGFLIVPALVLLARLDIHRAVATSLVIIVVNAAAGFIKHLHVLDAKGDTVDWNTIGIFVITGAIGSFAGKTLNARLNQAALQRGFAIFLLIMSVFIVIEESLTLLDSSEHAPSQPLTTEGDS